MASNLEEMIKKEEGNLKRYKDKMAEYATKVKATESRLAELNMMKDSQQLNQIQNMMSQNGLSMADFLAALQSGDMLTLQEKMEASQEAQTEADNDTDNTDANYGV